MPTHNLDLMRLHVDALYTRNANGRIDGCNQFDGGPVPRFHLARAAEGNHCVFRDDVPTETISALKAYAQREPRLTEPKGEPKFLEQYLEILGRDAACEAIWHGPAYQIEDSDTSDEHEIKDIGISNSAVLSKWMNDWIPDARHRHPFVALVRDGDAVAVCASARMSQGAHEAGIETAPGYRSQGFAKRVVGVWAKRVSALGAQAIYSTSWENVASQAVAKSLNLSFIGTDFHIR